MRAWGDPFVLGSSPVNGQREISAHDESRVARRHWILTVAGLFWYAYGSWLLVYAWVGPAEVWFLAYGRPLTCFAYGFGLLRLQRYVVWCGWVFVALLLGSAAVSGLLQDRFFVALIAAQVLVASYTTWVRDILRVRR